MPLSRASGTVPSDKAEAFRLVSPPPLPLNCAGASIEMSPLLTIPLEAYINPANEINPPPREIIEELTNSLSAKLDTFEMLVKFVDSINSLES